MTDRGGHVVQMPLGNSRKQRASSQASSNTADRYRKPSLASLNPDTFVPPFDVLNELAHNKEQYVGDEQQTIYAFPDYLRTALDRVRARVVDTTVKPGISPTICCCMHYGIEALLSCEDVQALLSLKDRFDLTDNPDTWLVEEVANVFRFFPLTLPDNTFSLSRKQNVSVTEFVKKETFRIANELGTSFSTIAVLSIMVTLCDQPCVPKERRDSIELTVSGFVRRAKIRHSVMDVLLNTVLEGRQS